MKLAKRSNPMTVDIEDQSMEAKIAGLRAKMAARRNNSMKSQSQIEKLPESPMVQAGAIVEFSATNKKKTGKREGLLRMVNSIGENEAERLEAEERKLQVLNRNLLKDYSRTGN
jgi:hypothetical protein